MDAGLTGERPAARRLDLRVSGQVQGVGFRPFVYRLARELDLTGWVRNDSGGVRIEVQGPGTCLEQFVERVRCGPAPLARVRSVEVNRLPPRPEQGFLIQASRRERAATGITPDTAVCAACLGELFDPQDRRYRYPFVNCTQCGPRFTITAALPYDRLRTSMAPFALCEACGHEYREPASRRFHAEPNACGDCGPRAVLLDAMGAACTGPDPFAAGLARLQRGEILAIKGIGGFHLACDARNPAAVARLRERKHREAKPLAVMALNVDSTRSVAVVDPPAGALLASPERPIVLLPKHASCDSALVGVAPRLASIGVMLPYAPIHYLLFHEAAGRPAGTRWLDEMHELVLVMTSANPAGEPLVATEREALARLGAIADAFLVHDREILARCDDSVALAREEGPVLVRRSRGYAPRAIPLAVSGPPVLALGGYFKSTVCATAGDSAYLSPHVGDLDNAGQCVALEDAVRHLLEVLELRPELLAHDLHPDFPSTRLAERLARERGIRLEGVQHHHAHVAAVAAEHGLAAPVLGLALDGVGLGTDGGAWGGELLEVGAGFERLGHLRPLALPGGDRAAREPWRMAASALHALGKADEIERRCPGEPGIVLRQMLDRGLHCPPTSSAGRYFDAAAGLLGVRSHCRYEAEAAMELEALAVAHGPIAPLGAGSRVGPDGELDLLPLLAHLAGQVAPARGAALFHATLADALARWVAHAAAARDHVRVVLAGGCLLNVVLATQLRARLRACGLEVYEAAQAPPNDGGLSLGQAWVAMMRAERRS